VAGVTRVEPVDALGRGATEARSGGYMGDPCTMRISTRWGAVAKLATTLERRSASRA
jgi:hypothetical protein